MKIETLQEILDNLGAYNDEYVVYIQKKQRIDKDTKVVVLPQEDGDKISAAENQGFSYFLEIFLMIEVIDVWIKWRNGKSPNIDDKIEAIAYYSENDAYLPVS